MTDYKMTDEWRKLLTEKVLGECWHDDSLTDTTTYELSKCSKCGQIGKGNRAFTADTDMLDVFRAIRDKGKWAEFYRFAGKHWLKDNDAWEREEPLEVWLFLKDPERACCLVAMFTEEQG